MLKMMKSDSFIEKGEKRKPIYFHKGLNVVMGNDTGANSIGKSTFLMIIDFIFGGEDYIKKSIHIQEEVGPHSFDLSLTLMVLSTIFQDLLEISQK